MASNDVIAAHAGHAEYREELLATGAQIYELRPDSGVIRKNWNGESNAGLHTKALVFDRKSVFIEMLAVQSQLKKGSLPSFFEGEQAK